MAKNKPGVYDRFLAASTEYKHRIIGRSCGEEKTGKTTFWLSAPGPIVVFDFDLGLEGVVEDFQKTKDIHIARYEWSPVLTSPKGDDDARADEVRALQERAIETVGKFESDFEHTLQNTDARTIIIDKESLLWELYRYAEFGEPKDAPLNYPQLNQRYRRVVSLPKAYSVNCGFIQGMKDEWQPKVNPRTGAQGAAFGGGRKAWGFKELPEIVQVNLFHSRKDGDFALTVGGSRGPGSSELMDETFTGTNFTELGMQLFPGTKEEDWE